MRSAARLLPLTVPLLRAKVALVASWPVLAYGASRLDAESISAWTWAFILGFSLLGWVVSDLDKVAELWNLEGKSMYERVRARFVLLKTIAAAEFAGVSTFFLGKLFPAAFLSMMSVKPEQAPELPEMALMLAAAFAGYMGARWFALIERKLLGGSSPTQS